MNKSWSWIFVGLLLSSLSSVSLAGPINLARVLDRGQPTGQMFASGDVTGSLTTLSAATFDSLSATDLFASYNVLLIGCCDSTDINVDWNTRLLPYLNLGGGIVFEAPYPQHVNDLAPAINATGLGNDGNTGSTGWAISQTVPGLTDGITNEFVNEHISINSYDTNLFDVFLTQNGVVEGLFGEIGTNGGRMVFTAPDNCLHGNRNGSGAGLNQYNLCLNSVKWVADGTATVPAPGTLVLLAIGLLGFGISRRPLR